MWCDEIAEKVKLSHVDTIIAGRKTYFKRAVSSGMNLTTVAVQVPDLFVMSKAPATEL